MEATTDVFVFDAMLKLVELVSKTLKSLNRDALRAQSAIFWNHEINFELFSELIHKYLRNHLC